MKEKFSGSTVTALLRSVFATLKPRRRKAVTVAPRRLAMLDSV